MTPELKAPITHVSFYHKRWFKRAMAVVVAVLTIGVVTAIFLFLGWWNSPEKALLDAGDYMVKTPGSYHVTAASTDLTITIRDYEYEAAGTFGGTKIDAIFFGGNLYVKSPDPEKLYRFFMGLSPAASIPAVVQSIIPTVVDKWISVNLLNVTLGSTNAQRIKCIAEEREAISHSSDARRQWGGTYLAHRFMDITTTKQPDQSLYELRINDTERTAFFNSLLKTSFYQSLVSCSKDSDILQNIRTNATLAHVVLTPKHVLKSFVIYPGAADATTATANYASVPDITVPTDAVSSDQLVIRYLQSVGQTITP